MDCFMSQVMEMPPTYLSGKSYHDQRIIGSTQVCFLAIYHGTPVYSFFLEDFKNWYQNSFHPEKMKDGFIQEEWRRLFLQEQYKIEEMGKFSFLTGLFCNNQFFLFRIGTGSAFVLGEHIRWITHTSSNTLQDWGFYTGRLQEKQCFFLCSGYLSLSAAEERALTVHHSCTATRKLTAMIHKRHSNQDVFTVHVQEEKGVEVYENGGK